MDDVAQLKAIPVCAACCCCFWTLFAVITLPLSFRALDQGKYALELSWTTQKIGADPVVDPGLYFVGLGNMLVEFPSTMQTMYFANIPKRKIMDDAGNLIESDMIEVYRPPMRARSQDGIEMYVSISFQWMLMPEALVPLYQLAGSIDFYDDFVRFARHAIVAACHEFAAESFFTNRLQITTRMKEYMENTFNDPENGLQVQITGLQLREVDLPDAFDQEIVNTQAAMQEAIVAEAERQVQITIKEREQAVAQEEVYADIVNSTGQAAQLLIQNEADVYQIKLFQIAAAQSNRQILQQFAGSSDPFGYLFQAMELRAIGSHNTSSLLLKV